MKLKLSFTLIAQLQKIIILTLIIIILSIAGFFLYKNCLKAVININKVSKLRNQVTLEKIDTQLFNKTIENIETKKVVPEVDWDNFKNPFLPYAVDNSEPSE